MKTLLKSSPFLFFLLLFFLLLIPGKSYSQEPDEKYTIVIHGGAGSMDPNMEESKKQAYLNSLSEALQIGKDSLAKGGSSLDAVEQVVRFLEDDSLFNAGRGAVFTSEGKNELDEFQKAAKEKVLSGGLSGRGSTTHFAGLVAMDELDLKVKWVPYDGAAESLAALAGKHLEFTICTAPSAVSLIRAGKLRPLIMFADKRDPYFADVPVPQELGFKVSSLPAVRGVEGPPNTPASIVKVLEEAFGKAVKEPGYLDWAQKVRVVINPLTSQEYAKLVADTYPQVEKVKQPRSSSWDCHR